MYKFVKIDEDSHVEISVHNDDGLSWDEVNKHYFNFLKACGYYFPNGAEGMDLIFDSEENEEAFNKVRKF